MSVLNFGSWLAYRASQLRCSSAVYSGSCEASRPEHFDFAPLESFETGQWLKEVLSLRIQVSCHCASHGGESALALNGGFRHGVQNQKLQYRALVQEIQRAALQSREDWATKRSPRGLRPGILSGARSVCSAWRQLPSQHISARNQA